MLFTFSVHWTEEFLMNVFVDLSFKLDVYQNVCTVTIIFDYIYSIDKLCDDISIHLVWLCKSHVDFRWWILMFFFMFVAHIMASDSFFLNQKSRLNIMLLCFADQLNQMKTFYKKTNTHERQQVRSCEGFELFAHRSQLQKVPLKLRFFPVSTTTNDYFSKFTIVPIKFIADDDIE